MSKYIKKITKKGKVVFKKQPKKYLIALIAQEYEEFEIEAKSKKEAFKKAKKKILEDDYYYEFEIDSVNIIEEIK